MLSDRLKTATSQLHEELESKMYSNEIMAGTLTRNQYIAMLQIQYEIVAPFELKWNSQISGNEDLLNLWKNRNKSKALEADLKSLKTTLPKINPVLFDSMNFDQLLGAAYVIEGSTLGGKIISKKLETNKQIPGDSVSYFTLYGNTTGEKWKTFLSFLNSHPLNPENTINGARKTFQLFIQAAK